MVRLDYMKERVFDNVPPSNDPDRDVNCGH